MRVALLIAGLTLIGAGVGAGSPAGAPLKLALQTQRTSPQDLEITGDVPGLAPGSSQFVRYADLAALPQVSYTVKDDTNFDGPVQLSGVPLDEILAALGFSGIPKQLIAAASADGYEGHYTVEYRAEHHPFLVLKMAGKEPAAWPKDPAGAPYAPYFISHERFTPLFHVLAQPDLAQVPENVVKLHFYDEAAVLGQLKPPVKAGVAAMKGYRIVLQNCLRCHSSGSIGGNKSPFAWPQLSLIAQGNAAAFGKYIVQPNRVNPEATMPPNPQFDPATVAALTAYFQSQGNKP